MTQLDAWNAEGVLFLFGIDAVPNLEAIAEGLPAYRTGSSCSNRRSP